VKLHQEGGSTITGEWWWLGEGEGKKQIVSGGKIRNAVIAASLLKRHRHINFGRTGWDPGRFPRAHHVAYWAHVSCCQTSNASDMHWLPGDAGVRSQAGSR